MFFTETELPGAWLLAPERHEDHRGFFARTFCEREFHKQGLDYRIVQCSTSFNRRKGTLRGMHFQIAPHEETKIVRCTRGAIHDVILDLRAGSPMFRRHVAVILSAENGRQLYIPKGVAHGFQTLEDNSEVYYQMTEFYEPSAARGVRWDDPAFGIQWPPDDRILIDRDRNYPYFQF